MDGKAISSAYRRAGSDFLASRLEGMFRVIKTEEDRALHNVVQREVMAIIDDEPVKFYRILAGRILETRARKSFLKKVAESILSVAKG